MVLIVESCPAIENSATSTYLLKSRYPPSTPALANRGRALVRSGGRPDAPVLQLPCTAIPEVILKGCKPNRPLRSFQSAEVTQQNLRQQTSLTPFCIPIAIVDTAELSPLQLAPSIELEYRLTDLSASHLHDRQPTTNPLSPNLRHGVGDSAPPR
jgi:hypothetical protein